MDRNEFAFELESLLNHSEAFYLLLSYLGIDSRTQLETKRGLLDFMAVAVDSLFEARSIIETMEREP